MEFERLPDTPETAGELIEFLSRFPAETPVTFGADGRDIWPEYVLHTRKDGTREIMIGD